MPDIALLGLILAAIIIGYLFGRRDQYRRSQQQGKGLSRDYFLGLNYLLNEQTDEAIETFIKVLDVNNDTVDTYLALGSLFCRRGEVDKSIRLHQDLLARPSLTFEQSLRVQLALAKDYFSAGLYDRAESILVDVSRQNHEYRDDALQNLLNVYERERDWSSAVEVAEQLRRSLGERYAVHLAHYYCELGEVKLRDNNRVSARQAIRQAFSRDKDSVRASLLLGQMEFEEGNYKEAVKALQRVSRQNSDFISLSIPMLELAYERLDGRRALAAYLSRCLNDKPSSAVILAMTRMLLRDDGNEKAIEFLTEQLEIHPTLKGLNVLLDLQISFQEEEAGSELDIIRRLSEKMLESKSVYRCEGCGFSGRRMHWQCPSCHSWQTIKPVQGIEGE
ncbi:hypothetical protein ACH42_16960 [Endozoicomonas sp. (ex Bugula neritina AB1)]|nr:hypothetical protein ACH42_16960 [Endozoicomonas sp. (ex Bugula neritina AB1)]